MFLKKDDIVAQIKGMATTHTYIHVMHHIHTCLAHCPCNWCGCDAGTQLQLAVWSLSGSSYHVISLLHHCLCWLPERWQAARYVITATWMLLGACPQDRTLACPFVFGSARGTCKQCQAVVIRGVQLVTAA